ncbi:Mitotic spindle and nuclear protein [Carabus blaptoides fortunei]
MRSLRSRVIEDSNTSASTTSNVDDANNIEQSGKKRKSKMIKTKKSKKRTSEINEDKPQGNFVLLRNRKSMTVDKMDENCKDQMNVSTDSQKTVNDNDGERKTRNAKRKKRKQSININDFCPTFESAITSTTVKPKKDIKFFCTSPVNNTLSAKEQSPNEQQIKRQKKGRRKQKISENSVKNESDVLMDTQNEHNFVRAPKHNVTDNTNILTHNTTFDEDTFSETVNESLKNKSVSLRERQSDVLALSNKHATFDKTNDECIKIDNTTFDNEKSSTKINKSTFDTTNNKTSIIHNNNEKNIESDNSTFELGVNTNNAESVSVINNKSTGQECSKINNGTFDVDDSILTKSRKSVSLAINKKVDQEHSTLDSDTFEIENSFKTHNRKRSSVLINKSAQEECLKIRDGTFEVEENTRNEKINKSGHVGFVFGNVDDEEMNRSVFKVNKTPYNHRISKSNITSFVHQDNDDESTDDETTPVSKYVSKKSIFENVTNRKDYVNLDDISDVELDEVINISDDTPNNSNVKQNVFNISKEESSVSKSVNLEGGDTFDMPVCNQSGEWQVQDLTKSINEHTYVDKTQFGTDNTFAVVNNEPFGYNYIAKNFTNNVLTPGSTRKKWQKFARNSQAANSVLEQINSTASTPRVVQNTKPRQYSSPFCAKDELSRKSFARNKSLLVSSSRSINKEPKSINKTLSSSKHDVSKSVVKRTAMPNFALIHQRAFEKMESLQEYSERKRQRAKLLLSTDKTLMMNNSGKQLENKENVKKKSARELFTGNTSKEHNRFGFKVRNIAIKQQSPIVTKKVENATAATVFFKSTNIVKPKLIIPKSMMSQDMLSKKEKVPIFQRKDMLAIGNKNKGENLMKNRENRRDLLKGVRTNRRFELLMKMRNNQ